MRKTLLVFAAVLFSYAAWAQQYVSGKVYDQKSGEPLAGVNITIKGTNQGTTTDFNGNFRLHVASFPTTLVFSYLGYATQEKSFNGPAQDIKIGLAATSETLNDVVITASKTKERVLETPVTIEHLSAKVIPYATAPSFYEELNNLRGVQMNTNSLTFQALNMRGFATFSNNRVLQIIDGLDNSSPALNFPLGNLVGINDLDVERVELLPGTSSALYGANAFNGLINITSKNPFKYPGLSTSLKAGVTQQSAAGTKPMFDVGVRYAKAFDKFAFKVNLSYLQATDWYAVDYSDYDRSLINASRKGSRESNPSYDGLNIYGDEIATTIDLTGYGLYPIHVSRTGYKEIDLTDNKAASMKGDFGLYYRPNGKDSDLEISWTSRFGSGQTIYQGSNRYNLKGILIHQHKLELRDKNYFVRAYYTSEDAGKSYDMRFAAWNVNRAWKSDRDWFTQYAQAFAVARLMNGLTDEQAHAVARAYADQGRLEPGTDAYRQAFESIIDNPDFKTGAKFVDHTTLFHVEGNYSFKNLIPNGDIQIGGSFRRFSLRSDGTIFTDYDGPIFINERAAFAQYIQKLFDGHLKFNASIRFDKQNQFKTNFSPRVALVWLPDTDRKQSLRIAYQTGFRNPTTQDLYIGLDLGYASLVGGSPDNWDRYEETGTDAMMNQYVLTGTDAYTNSYTLNSFMNFAVSHDPTQLEPAKIRPIGPEKIESFEIGYRGELGLGWSADIVGYRNFYKDFIMGQSVIAIPKSYGSVNDGTAVNGVVLGAYKPVGVFTNSDIPITSYGFDMALTKHYENGLKLTLIYDYAKMDVDRSSNPDMKTYFNTPENTVKVILSHRNLVDNVGFSVAYKYMDKYFWESSFADAWVPQHHTFDAMVSYRIPKYNLMAKVGGSNIFGPDYMVAPGTGKVGQIFYFSLLFKK